MLNKSESALVDKSEADLINEQKTNLINKSTSSSVGKSEAKLVDSSKSNLNQNKSNSELINKSETENAEMLNSEKRYSDSELNNTKTALNDSPNEKEISEKSNSQSDITKVDSIKKVKSKKGKSKAKEKDSNPELEEPVSPSKNLISQSKSEIETDKNKDKIDKQTESNENIDSNNNEVVSRKNSQEIDQSKIENQLEVQLNENATEEAVLIAKTKGDTASKSSKTSGKSKSSKSHQKKDSKSKKSLNSSKSTREESLKDLQDAPTIQVEKDKSPEPHEYNKESITVENGTPNLDRPISDKDSVLIDKNVQQNIDNSDNTGVLVESEQNNLAREKSNIFTIKKDNLPRSARISTMSLDISKNDDELPQSNEQEVTLLSKENEQDETEAKIEAEKRRERRRERRKQRELEKLSKQQDSLTSETNNETNPVEIESNEQQISSKSEKRSKKKEKKSKKEKPDSAENQEAPEPTEKLYYDFESDKKFNAAFLSSLVEESNENDLSNEKYQVKIPRSKKLKSLKSNLENLGNHQVITLDINEPAQSHRSQKSDREQELSELSEICLSDHTKRNSTEKTISKKLKALRGLELDKDNIAMEEYQFLSKNTAKSLKKADGRVVENYMNIIKLSKNDPRFQELIQRKAYEEDTNQSITVNFMQSNYKVLLILA